MTGDPLEEMKDEIEDIADLGDDDGGSGVEDTSSRGSKGGGETRRSGSPPPLSELPDVTSTELKRRAHSYRGFEPVEIDAVIDYEGKREAREVLGYIESGRWNPMLRSIHKAYIPLDADEQKMMWEGSPELLEWTGVWARANDQYDVRRDRPES